MVSADLGHRYTQNRQFQAFYIKFPNMKYGKREAHSSLLWSTIGETIKPGEPWSNAPESSLAEERGTRLRLLALCNGGKGPH